MEEDARHYLPMRFRAGRAVSCRSGVADDGHRAEGYVPSAGHGATRWGLHNVLRLTSIRRPCGDHSDRALEAREQRLLSVVTEKASAPRIVAITKSAIPTTSQLTSTTFRVGESARSRPLLYFRAMFYRTPVQWTAIFVLAAASLAFWARFALGYFGAV